MRRQLKCLGLTMLAAVGAALVAGCSGSGGAAYAPADRKAREALEAALAAWQRGEPPGRIESAKPAIEVSDSKRPAGQKLVRFEISDEPASDGPKQFSVKLVLENPSAEQTARFVVFGRDPIWVQRAEDYDRSQGM